MEFSYGLDNTSTTYLMPHNIFTFATPTAGCGRGVLEYIESTPVSASVAPLNDEPIFVSGVPERLIQLGRYRGLFRQFSPPFHSVYLVEII